jgi:hypothetical protein
VGEGYRGWERKDPKTNRNVSGSFAHGVVRGQRIAASIQFISPQLMNGWESEILAPQFGSRPPRGHDFPASVEVHSLFPMHVRVAEQ